MGAKLNPDSLAGGVRPFIPPVLGHDWLESCKSWVWPSVGLQGKTSNKPLWDGPWAYTKPPRYTVRVLLDVVWESESSGVFRVLPWALSSLCTLCLDNHIPSHHLNHFSLPWNQWGPIRSSDFLGQYPKIGNWGKGKEKYLLKGIDIDSGLWNI